MHDNRKLDSLSTHSQEIKWLGMPEHEKYQDQWKNFYDRYHTPIINYILKKANWTVNRTADAETIASVVYEKGFRWSFKKQRSIRFRFILKRLVKDALSDYMRKQKSVASFVDLYEGCAVTEDTTDTLSVEILQVASKRIIETYKGRQQDILLWVWDNGRWPKAEEMVDIFAICGKDAEKNKQAARQWHKRNRGLWQDFQDKLRHEISKLAIGNDEIIAEVQHFENLET
ncbi:hypothetical protein [Candidatus Uabimicrobium sp. HlEnr_7]|uniref:hypothetical protein n=1 Tax=Candidatus Uabimicrobium helgolandensis TaxID=3095367 RepID=UPI003556D53E